MSPIRSVKVQALEDVEVQLRQFSMTFPIGRILLDRDLSDHKISSIRERLVGVAQEPLDRDLLPESRMPLVFASWVMGVSGVTSDPQGFKTSSTVIALLDFMASFWTVPHFDNPYYPRLLLSVATAWDVTPERFDAVMRALNELSSFEDANLKAASWDWAADKIADRLLRAGEKTSLPLNILAILLLVSPEAGLSENARSFLLTLEPARELRVLDGVLLTRAFSNDAPADIRERIIYFEVKYYVRTGPGPASALVLAVVRFIQSTSPLDVGACLLFLKLAWVIGRFGALDIHVLRRRENSWETSVCPRYHVGSAD